MKNNRSGFTACSQNKIISNNILLNGVPTHNLREPRVIYIIHLSEHFYIFVVSTRKSEYLNKKNNKKFVEIMSLTTCNPRHLNSVH